MTDIRDWRWRFSALRLHWDERGKFKSPPAKPLTPYVYRPYDRLHQEDRPPVSLPAVGGFVKRADKLMREFDRRARL